MLSAHIKTVSDFYDQWLTLLQPIEHSESKEEILKAKKQLLQYKMQANVYVIRYDAKQSEYFEAFLKNNEDLEHQVTPFVVENIAALGVQQVIDANLMSAIFWVEDNDNKVKVSSHIKLLASYLPTVIIIANDLRLFQEQINTFDFPNLLDVQYVSKNSLAESSCASLVQPYFDKNKSNGIAAAQAFQTFLNFDAKLMGKLEKEISDFSNKKMLLQQDETLRQRSSNVGGSAGMELKNRLNTILYQYEERIDRAIEENFTSHLGDISINTERLIDQINKLSDRKAGKNTIYFLPDSIKIQLVDYAKQRSKQFCNTEIEVFYKFLERVEAETSAFQREQKIQLSLNLQKEVNRIEAENLLAKHLRIERNFETTMATKTTMELLMGARKSYMMVMMVSGMLGMGGAVMKKRFDFMPVLILLVGAGWWKMKQNAKIEEEEALEKNLTSFRDALRTEMRRSLDNTGRVIKTWLFEQLKNFIEKYAAEIEQKIESRNNAGSYAQKSPILLRLEKEETTLNDIVKNRKSRLERELSNFRASILGAYSGSGRF